MGLVRFSGNFLAKWSCRGDFLLLRMIHQSWKQDVYDDGDDDGTMKEVGLNLDAWSKAYEDISLSYLFMMNNHCHFSQMKGTQLGDIMGDSWLEAHEKYKDYCAALYLRESWGKLLPLLSQKGLISFPFDHQDFDNKLL
ncbi:hypothetical protein CerSpe_102140 [Prunus speciosa]